MKEQVKGYIHSIQSLGTLDGEGVRFVVFTQGCNLRCGCCHNPDTWNIKSGKTAVAEEIVQKAVRYKEYFGKDGGITISGGEPLLQPEFVKEIFSLCHKNGINTCLDTSGSILNDRICDLLDETDRVLLDIKYTSDKKYRQYVGCTLGKVLEFLEVLQSKKIPVTLRQVIIPTLNDTENDIAELKKIAASYPCIDKTELLPFKKICSVKYEQMGIDFPFKHIPTPDTQTMQRLQKIISD